MRVASGGGASGHEKKSAVDPGKANSATPDTLAATATVPARSRAVVTHGLSSRAGGHVRSSSQTDATRIHSVTAARDATTTARAASSPVTTSVDPSSETRPNAAPGTAIQRGKPPPRQPATAVPNANSPIGRAPITWTPSRSSLSSAMESSERPSSAPTMSALWSTSPIAPTAGAATAPPRPTTDHASRSSARSRTTDQSVTAATRNAASAKMPAAVVIASRSSEARYVPTMSATELPYPGESRMSRFSIAMRTT